MPTIASLAPTSGPQPGGNSVVITGSGFSGVGPLTVRFGSVATTFTIDSDTRITATAPAGTGTVPVTVTALLGGTSNALPYTYVAVPFLTSISPAQGPAETTVTVNGSGLSGATGVNFGSTPATSFTVVSETEITAVVPLGTGIVPVTVTSPVGTSNALPYIYVVFPTLTSLSPTSGPPSGGNHVVITGTGFTGPTTVRFGSTATTFTIDSPTRITAIAPPGTGTVQVTVTTSASTSNALDYTYITTPTLISVSPNSGAAAGGNTVILTGTGFTGATAVNFGATAALSFSIDSDTQITATVPGGTGTADVTVTTIVGTSNPVSYTYIPAPTLTSVVPSSGPSTGGNPVILTGADLTGTTTVLFGATPAVEFVVVSDTQISAVAPAGTGVVDVTVATAGGSSGPVTYTYVPAPTLASILPDSGPESGGNTVTLTGTNLTGTTAVYFNGTPAISFTVVSDTQITAVVAAGTAGAVVVTDTTAGGTSNGVLYTYVAAPTLASVVPDSGPVTGGDTVVLRGTGFTGVTAVRFGATPATSFTVVSGTEISAIAPAGTGTVNVAVTATGGTSNPATYSYVSAPVLGSVVPASGPETGGNTVILTGTNLTGATAVHFDANTAIAFTVVSGTQIAAEVPAGTGIVDVTVTTAGGVSNPVTYTHAPVPGLTSIVPDSGPETGGNTVTVTGTNLAGAIGVHFNGTPAISFTAVSDTQITAVVPTGTGFVDVTVTTAGGTSNPVNYTYIPAPVLVSVVPGSGPEAGGNTVILTGANLTGATSVHFDGTPATSFTVVSDAEIAAVVPAGSGTDAVTVTTPGGVGNGVAYVYVPVPALASVVPGSGPETGGNTVILTGTNLAGATALEFAGTPAVSFVVVSDSQISAVVPAGTGSANVTVTTAGGVSDGVYTYVPAPTLAAVVPDSGPETGGNTVTLSGTGFTGATVVNFGLTPAVSFTVVSDTEISAVAPARTGTAAVTVTAVGGTSNAVLYTLVPAPSLAALIPDSGPETGGNTVSLVGSNFTGTTAVDFDGTAAISFTVVSDAEITAVVPAGTGMVAVTVTTAGGAGNGVAYVYVPAPTLTTVVPDSGPETGGNTVTLSGTGFTGATAVDFGANTAVSFVVVSDSQISAVVPAGTGTANVTVTTAGGVSDPVAYTYVPAPTLASIVPDSGPETGGNTVVLTGTGFTGATVVNFGPIPASSFTVVSDTEISAVAPARTGTAAVTVTAIGGTSNAVFYTFVPAPTLAAIVPDSGPETGGTTVTLNGTNFTGATAVHFGATPAISFTVVSDTEITAVAPAGTGAATVTVTTPGGSTEVTAVAPAGARTAAVAATLPGRASSAVSYVYVPAPALASVVPGSGPETGGNTVTLTGANLTGVTALDFDGTPAVSFTVVSDTEITAVAPAGTGAVNITVTTAGGISNSVVYAYVPAPTLAAVVPDSGPEAGGNAVVLTGTGFTSATVVNFGLTPASSFTVLSDTEISAVAPARTGTAAVTVTAIGGTSNAVLYTFVPAPSLVAVTPDSGPQAGGTTVTLTGTNLTDATAVHFGVIPATSFTVVSDTEITAVAPAGTGTVAVTVTTPGGVGNGVAYVYVAAPTLATVAPASGPENGGNTVTLSGTDFGSATAVDFGASAAVSFAVVSDTEISAVVPAGTGSVNTTVTTAGGVSDPVLYAYVPAPTLAAVVPDSGPETGGNTVILSGTGFTGATVVNFGLTPAVSFTVVSDTEIAAVAPARTGTAAVTVTAIGGTSNAVLYTFVPAPTLAAIVPDSGPETGGTTVTLTGTNLTGATAVHFGVIPATSFTVVSDTELSAVTPAGTGTVAVTVTTPGGVGNGVAYVYVPAPTLTMVAPDSGPETGGNTVTITGANLAGATEVTFGATAATSFTVVSDTEISAVAPAGTGTVAVSVTTTGGSSNGISYSYVLVPALDSVVPNSGPFTGGNTVSLIGTNLTGVTSVLFGAVAAGSFTVLSDTQISVAVPAGAGTVLVTVVSPTGTSNGVLYIYGGSPALLAVIPDLGPEAGGNTVVLQGDNFTGALAVDFGVTAATSFTVDSDAQITAVVPAGTGTVPVTVTNQFGIGNSVTYHYLGVPTLTSVDPDQGPTSGGNTITLTGTAFTGASGVEFGGTAAISFTVVSDTEITAVAPAGTGTAQVTVTTPGGTSNAATYVYVAAPTLATVAPASGPENGGNTVTLSGTDFGSATAVDFGASAAVSFAVVSDTEISAVVPAGTGSVNVTVTTAGGVSNGVLYAYVPAPTLASIVPDSGPETGGNTVVLTGTGFTGATVVNFGLTPAVSFTVVSDTEISAVAPARTAAAAVTVATIGGTSNAVLYTFVPASSLVAVAPDSGPQVGGNTVILTGTGFTGATAVRFGVIPATSFTVVSDTELSAVAPAGSGTAAVTVTTPGGASNGVFYVYVPAPTLTTVVPDSGPETGGNAVTLSGTGFTGATAVDFGASAAVSFAVVSDAEISAVVPAGTGLENVTVTTAGGVSNAVVYTYVPAPTLAAVVPDSGPEASGNAVVLTGTGFTGATVVNFGLTPAVSFTVVSDTEISAVAPARTGAAAVTVTAIGGTSNAVVYTFVPAPTLAAVIPDSGPETGGNTVTLAGVDLAGASAVDFDGTAAISFTVVSDTEITAVVPAGAGTVAVTVTTPGGASNGVSYVYVPAPALTSVVPDSGPETGGNTVTITGTGLSDTTALHFDGTPAVSFAVVSDSEISAVVPAGTGSVNVTVTTAGGTSNSVAYTYVPAPTLASIVPDSGPETGGNTVVLTGTGFTGSTVVNFGPIPASSFTVVSDTEISAVAPARTGTAAVTVTAIGGTSNAVLYTFVPAPTLASINPDSGPEAGGTPVTLTGTNFTGATAVHFGVIPATSFTVVSDTELGAVAPAGSGTVAVTVTTQGGASNGVAYVYVPAPALASVVPDSGPEAGGNTVTLTGADLTSATAVDFDGTPAVSFAVVSDSQITAVAPAGTGSANVTVTTTGGTSIGASYTYVPAPTLAAVIPDSGPETGGNAVVLTGTGFTGATVVSFGLTTAVSFTVVSDTEISAVAPARTGAAAVTVTAIGGTSNAVLYTFVRAPSLVAVAPDSGPQAGGTTVTLTGTNLTGATAVRFGGTAAISFTVVSDTEITAVAPAGTGTVAVTVTTPGGVGNGVAYAYVPAPTLASVAPTSGPETGGNTVTLTGTNLTNSTAVHFGAVSSAFTVVSDSEISVTAPPGAGAVGVTVTTAGGTSAPVVYAYVPAPTLASVVPDSGPTTGGNTVILTGTGFTSATSVNVGANTAVSFAVVSDSQISAVIPAEVAGTVTVKVTATGGTSNGVLYTYIPAPTLTAVVPNSGPVTGGTSVVLDGTGFTGASSVRFGATPAISYTVVSDTQISAVVPAGTAGAVAVTVTTVGGVSNGVVYTYVAAPTLTSVVPGSGPVAGGNTVTLSGAKLTGTTVVRFGANTAVSFTVVSDSQINAVVPAGTAGPVAVTATTAGGTSNGVVYTYVAAPTLTSVSPSSGPAAGGNTVTLSGAKLTGTTAVRFGANTAVSFTVVSDSQISAVVPAGTAGPVAVTVTTVGGASNGVVYTYVAAPTLASVAPSSGPLAGGNTVTLIGTGFTGASAVSFGATPATSFTVISGTQISAVVPARAAGSAAVTVTTVGGTSNGVLYTYVPVPTLTSVVSNSGPAAGGNTVTLTGTGFTGASAVNFGTTPATSFTVISGTQISAVVPARAAGSAAVTVTTVGGTSNGVLYTHLAPPTLTQLSPNNGSVSGGNTITLTGTNFTGATAVRFGTKAATSFTITSSTRIRATVPSGTGVVAVTVTGPGGTSNGLSYTYHT
ncbi:IPT/TIG domain-containing protein [Nocardia sp. NBC_00508]|uniref:IPT/TIG domain-containing protein n=1 Tax=Nocardia sp. NBC_00508 TaxID=2975992 RepID=UPI002E81B981|nr:IPT/TIG domain-containing protein [Nocardia sp. NBC_00508]WUD64473.1 IPT/TIG domain-containing protein [Nocardia sp. NBC_00508]